MSLVWFFLWQWNGKKVDAIVVGGIGAGAIYKLNNMGIKVYKAVQGTVQTNIELFINNTSNAT